MDDEQIAGLANKALRPLLEPFGLDRIEAIPGRDHDDAPSLFITAYYRKDSKVPQGDVLLKALSVLHKALVDAGEQRFPYLDHRFSEDETFEDEVADSDETARPQ